nr:4983_t:CDS:2 [Entrophospora candida]
MSQQQQTLSEQLPQQSQLQQNYYDNGEFEHSVQQLIQQQRLQNNNEEDSLIAAISHHMLIIKDYRVKINQHHFELEQVVNILRRRDNSRDLNLNFSSFQF